jgi:hypothetical protein
VGGYAWAERDALALLAEVHEALGSGDKATVFRRDAVPPPAGTTPPPPGTFDLPPDEPPKRQRRRPSSRRQA